MTIGYMPRGWALEVPTNFIEMGSDSDSSQNRVPSPDSTWRARVRVGPAGMVPGLGLACAESGYPALLGGLQAAFPGGNIDFM